VAERKRRTKRQTGAPETAPAPVHLIVRRGAIRRYAKLTEKTQEMPVVVSWDRRKGHAGGDGQPPAVERRGTPPFTWETADFLVVHEGKAPARKRKAPRAATRKK